MSSVIQADNIEIDAAQFNDVSIRHSLTIGSTRILTDYSTKDQYSFIDRERFCQMTVFAISGGHKYVGFVDDTPFCFVLANREHFYSFTPTFVEALARCRFKKELEEILNGQ